MDRELLRSMEDAGCYSFSVGIESGSPHVVSDMKRSETLEVMMEKINLISSTTKIRMTGYFMMGYPTEKREDMEKTIELAMKLPLHRAQFSNFIPLPGTAIYDDLIADGKISPDIIEWDLYLNNRVVYSPHLNNRVVYSPQGISKREMRRLMRKAFAMFYFRVQIARGLLKEIHSLGQLGTVIRRSFDVFR